MPKIKSHRSAVKRFKVSGNGKILRNTSGISHKNMKKRGRQKRQLSIPVVITGKNRNRVIKLLGKLK